MHPVITTKHVRWNFMAKTLGLLLALGGVMSTAANAETLIYSGTADSTRPKTNIVNGDTLIFEPVETETMTQIFPFAFDTDRKFIAQIAGTDTPSYYYLAPNQKSPDPMAELFKDINISVLSAPILLSAQATNTTSATRFQFYSAGALEDGYSIDDYSVKDDKNDMTWTALDGGKKNRHLYLAMNPSNQEVALEHIIFMGGYAGASANGGAISASSAATTRTTIITGDLIFMDNAAGNNGGAFHLNSNGNVVFRGKAIFVDNKSGYQTDNEIGGLMRFRTDTGTGRGGAIFATSTSNITFDDDAIFIGNISSAAGGAVYMFGGTGGSPASLTFNGKAIFLNNMAGAGCNSHGGAISFLQTGGPNKLFFADAAIFVGNQATSDGGAIRMNSTAAVTFSSKAILTDNSAGSAERIVNVDLGSNGVVPPEGTTATLNGNNGSGGAMQLNSLVDLKFYDSAQLERNKARGNGGAINAGSALTDGLGITFSDDTVISHNAAGMFQGTAASASNPSGGGVNSTGAVWFSPANGIKLLSVTGNLAITQYTSTTSGELAWQGNGGALSSRAIYIDQKYTFDGNQAQNGGAIQITSGNTATAGSARAFSLELNKEGVFRGNVAGSDGGAIAATIASGSGVFISSGAKFLDNVAGDFGGAIWMSGDALASITMRADTDDIIFKGNLAHVTINYDDVSHEKVVSRDSDVSGGYMTWSAGSRNDINFITSSATAASAGMLNLDAADGRKIHFDGGISQSYSGVAFSDIETITRDLLKNVTINKTGAGMVEFDNAVVTANLETTVSEGTLRLLGGMSFGYSGTQPQAAGTKFVLDTGATLEASARVSAETIQINAGSTLRVLDGGTLVMNSPATVTYDSGITIAGNGILYAGASAINNVGAIIVGDAGHTTAQTLTLRNTAANQALAASFGNATLTFGLFSGTSDKLVVNSANFQSTPATINLSSVALTGNYTLISTTGGISGFTTASLTFNGAQIIIGDRLTYSFNVVGNDLLLNYTANNTSMDWNGGDGGQWGASDANWTNGSQDYILGDVVNFTSARNGEVKVNENVGVSGMNVSGNYTFTGTAGITTTAGFWNGAGAQEGRLVKTGASTLVTLANATGDGAGNDFAGIDIESGTLAFGTAAQLGTALENVRLGAAAADNATLAIVGNAVLTGDRGAQRLAIDSGKVGTLAVVGSANSLAVLDSSAGSLNGGVFHVDDGGTLNINAEGDIFLRGNAAAAGGAMYLEAGATSNINVGAGVSVSFGQSVDYTNRIDANITTMDSLASADDTANIYKTGAGVLSLNGDSSAYLGTLSVDSGTVLLGHDSKFGGSVVIDNINNASTAFGGGGQVLGNLTANAGVSIMVGGAHAPSSQTLTIAGTASFTDSTLVFGGYDVSNEVRTNILTADTLNLDGLTTFDFDFGSLTTGTYLIASVTRSHEEDYAIAGITYQLDEESGTMKPTGTYNGLVTVEVANITNTGSIHITNQGSDLTGGRTTARIVIEAIVASGTVGIPPVLDPETGDPIISGTYMMGDSGSNMYYTGNIYGDITTLNYMMRWTGSADNRWTTKVENWISADVDSKEFYAGDGVVFDSTADAGHETNRTVEIQSSGVTVGEMWVAGDGNYTVTGGKINGNGNASTLAKMPDSETTERASGMLIKKGAGTLTLQNASNVFSGGIVIEEGTVIGTVANLNNNTITNNANLIFDQAAAESFIGTIDGAGHIVKTGMGVMTLNSGNTIHAGSMLVAQGRLALGAGNLVEVTGTLTVTADASLMLANSGMSVAAGELNNSGAIFPNGNPTTMGIAGNYVGNPGSTISLVLREYATENTSVLVNESGVTASDALYISGNATGKTSLIVTHTLFTSGTHVSLTAARRDMRIIAIAGDSNIDFDINGYKVGEVFEMPLVTSSEVDHSIEVVMLRGQDGDYYLRNVNVAPTSYNMPVIGISPIVSELIGRVNMDALYQRINGRHEKIEKGPVVWSNFTYNDSRLKTDFYEGQHVRTSLIQLGAETACINDNPDTGISLLAGASYAYATTRVDFARPGVVTYGVYMMDSTGDPTSKLEVDSHIFNVYAEARLGGLYVDAIVNYSPDASYKAATTAALDSNGTVKGNRFGASMEIGYLFHPPKGGQWEPFARLDYQNAGFGAISDPEYNTSFERDGRDYSFDGYSGLRAQAGLRAGAKFDLSENWTFSPWGSISGGKSFSPKADVQVGRFAMDTALSNAFYSYSGGMAARWNDRLTIYFLASWTGGDDYNGYTFTGGANYHW
jgi:autotransporter-associated beta strand protein/predicted outer membrane repeat protein